MYRPTWTNLYANDGDVPDRPPTPPGYPCYEPPKPPTPPGYRRPSQVVRADEVEESETSSEEEVLPPPPPLRPTKKGKKGQKGHKGKNSKKLKRAKGAEEGNEDDGRPVTTILRVPQTPSSMVPPPPPAGTTRSDGRRVQTSRFLRSSEMREGGVQHRQGYHYTMAGEDGHHSGQVNWYEPNH